MSAIYELTVLCDPLQIFGYSSCRCGILYKKTIIQAKLIYFRYIIEGGLVINIQTNLKIG